MNTWTDFWQKKQGVFDEMMHHYTYFTAKKLHENKHILPSDEVLDIGCGQGRMADFYKEKIKKWVGLDISENYINDCKNKFKNIDNFSFATIPSDDYLNFGVLENQKFDKIVVMSVIQYFKNHEEIAQLIQNAQKYLKPNGKIIIADIVMSEKKLKSVWNILLASLQHRFFFTFVRFVWYMIYSNEYKLCQKQHFLIVSKEILENIIQKNNLNTELLDNLTIDKQRKTLIIMNDK